MQRGRFFAYCTATGKVLLAWQPSAEIERVLRAGLARSSPRTIADPDLFRRRLGEVRRQGYAVVDHERETLTRAVAAPVRATSGEVVAALTVAGPSGRLTLPRLREVAALVVGAARRLSQEIDVAPAPAARRRGTAPRRG